MTVSTLLNTKTIDELKELGKLNGDEKTIVSTGDETRKVSIDTIIGYAASILNNTNTNVRMMSLSPSSSSSNSIQSKSIIIVPEGEEIDINERTPGSFYLEQTKQTSIRTAVNIPTSVTVSSNLGLRRV